MMQTPPDYPLEQVEQPESELSDNTEANAQITYGALRHRVSANQAVTDEMINAARLKLECAYEAVDDIAIKESKLTAITRRLRLRRKARRQ